MGGDSPKNDIDHMVVSRLHEISERNRQLETRVKQLEKEVAGLRMVEKHPYLFEEPVNTIRDAIHGIVSLSDEAYRMIDTKLFQRLKYIHLRLTG